MTVTEDTPAGEPEVVIICSFCQKPKTEVATMIAGHGMYICDACVALCVEIIEGKTEDTPKVTRWEERLTDDELLASLPKIVAVGRQVDEHLASYVRQARSRGITWTRIGSALGMTRQSAWERFSGEE